jgi:hypothetical protein
MVGRSFSGGSHIRMGTAERVKLRSDLYQDAVNMAMAIWCHGAQSGELGSLFSRRSRFPSGVRFWGAGMGMVEDGARGHCSLNVSESVS